MIKTLFLFFLSKEEISYFYKIFNLLALLSLISDILQKKYFAIYNVEIFSKTYQKIYLFINFRLTKWEH